MPSPVRIVVAEDEAIIRLDLVETLQEEGYIVVADTGRGDTAIELVREHKPDVAIFDIKMPGLDGLDLCRQIRQSENSIPILVVSARDSERDRVLGLEVGADDYLVKPFGMRELVARCRALLRRSNGGFSQGRVLEHANLRLFTEECRVTRDGQEVNLSPKEYRLLELFMQNPRRVWSRDKLLEHIWGFDYFGDSKTVDVHIRWLREKLETNPSNPEHLLTVRGFGYRFG